MQIFKECRCQHLMSCQSHMNAVIRDEQGFQISVGGTDPVKVQIVPSFVGSKISGDPVEVFYVFRDPEKIVLDFLLPESAGTFQLVGMIAGSCRNNSDAGPGGFSLKNLPDLFQTAFFIFQSCPRDLVVIPPVGF